MWNILQYCNVYDIIQFLKIYQVKSQTMRLFILIAGLFLSLAAPSAELILKPVKVAPDIYAVIGDLGAQTSKTRG